MITIIHHAIGCWPTMPIPGVDPSSQRIIFCDPPYNLGQTHDGDITQDRLRDTEYKEFCSQSIRDLYFHLMPGGTIWWLCPAAHVNFIPRLLTRHVGPQRYMIIKQESFAQYQDRCLTQDYRLLFCHVRPGAPTVFNPDPIRIRSKRQEMGDKRASPNGRVPGQIWTFRRLQGTSADRVPWHPCQLPPELLRRIVLGWSNSGDQVLDAYAGSGNMGLVCRALNRNATLVEQSAYYCQKMKERLEL